MTESRQERDRQILVALGAGQWRLRVRGPVLGPRDPVLDKLARPAPRRPNRGRSNAPSRAHRGSPAPLRAPGPDGPRRTSTRGPRFSPTPHDAGRAGDRRRAQPRNIGRRGESTSPGFYRSQSARTIRSRGAPFESGDFSRARRIAAWVRGSARSSFSAAASFPYFAFWRRSSIFSRSYSQSRCSSPGG